MGRVTNRYDVYDKRGKLLAHDITVPEFADAYRLNRKNVSIAVSRSRAVDYKYRFVRINDPVINSGTAIPVKSAKHLRKTGEGRRHYFMAMISQRRMAYRWFVKEREDEQCIE